MTARPGPRGPSELAFIEEAARAAVSRAELWRRLLDVIRPATVVEIGVLEGDFSAELLRSCASIRRYYMIDPWRRLDDWNKPLNTSDERLGAAYEKAMRNTDFAAEKRVVLRGATLEVAGQIADGEVDFAYVDADHTLRGITIDLVRIYPKVALGGWLGGDDFERRIWRHGPRFEPTLVFPFAVHFAEAMGAEVFALPHAQFLMRRPLAGEGGFRFVDLAGGYSDRSLLSQFTPLDRTAIRLSRRLRRRVGSKS